MCDRRNSSVQIAKCSAWRIGNHPIAYNRTTCAHNDGERHVVDLSRLIWKSQIDSTS